MKKTKNNASKQSSVVVMLRSKRFATMYLIGALIILAGTTVLWSLQSAHLQMINADQLVNGYLFESNTTFKQATLPAQHTFLLKWPLFYALKLLNFNSTWFAAITVLLSLATVALFVLILRKFERRPLLLGTLSLMMASVLLLVPAQPGLGGMLPVNMAMITTRNLEYVLYLGCILGLAGVKSVQSKRFLFSVLSLSLLLATDKFFVSISAAGGLLALFVYALRKKWAFVNFSVRWLAASLLAVAGSACIIWFINSFGISQISGNNGASPYQIIHSLHDFVLGTIYGLLALLTNFGANPAHRSLVLTQMPKAAGQDFFSFAIVGYAANIVIFSAASYSGYSIIKETLATKNHASKQTPRHKVAIGMVASTLAAFMAFIFSVHYYAGDARYLAISFFAGFVCLAQYISKQKYDSQRIVVVGSLLCVAIISGIFGTLTMNRQLLKAQSVLSSRNKTISSVLKKHKTDVLVGDYWRVVPVRQQAGQMNILPLSDCTVPRGVLSSRHWQKDLSKHSFAYILSLDKLTPDFPQCGFTEVIRAYGNPSSSVLIEGSVKNPRELLLFYDEGIRPAASFGVSPASASILPIKLNQLPSTDCPTGETIMNVVAHQDDDLLFMNPDIMNSLNNGNCNRTVYVTAGDAGMKLQWLKREQGSKAAYAQMLGIKNPVWTERVVEVNADHYVKVASMRGEPRVSLIFMHLPDGNLHGDGFFQTSNQSLAKLFDGSLTTINAVDGQSRYTKDQLIESLFLLMQAYQPTSVRSQSTVESNQFNDHNDHHRVSDFTTAAHEKYQTAVGKDMLTILLSYYVGYPVRDQAENVSNAELVLKQNAFFEYAKFDGSVCGSLQECAQTPTYNAYLTHQIVSAY